MQLSTLQFLLLACLRKPVSSREKREAQVASPLPQPAALPKNPALWPQMLKTNISWVAQTAEVPEIKPLDSHPNPSLYLLQGVILCPPDQNHVHI